MRRNKDRERAVKAPRPSFSFLVLICERPTGRELDRSKNMKKSNSSAERAEPIPDPVIGEVNMHVFRLATQGVCLMDRSSTRRAASQPASQVVSSHSASSSIHSYLRLTSCLLFFTASVVNFFFYVQP